MPLNMPPIVRVTGKMLRPVSRYKPKSPPETPMRASLPRLWHDDNGGVADRFGLAREWRIS
jgi:hypothetical protein